MLKPLSTSSFTRFLIPLADVMTLLFSLFLLLPHVQQQPGEESANAAIPGRRWTPEEQRQAEEELSRLRRFMQMPAGKRLHAIVLDIDGDTGDLVLQQGKQQVLLSDQNIDMLVREHEAAARVGDQQLFYLLRLPRPGPEGVKFHPTQADIQKYRRWFENRKVDYQIERPRS